METAVVAEKSLYPLEELGRGTEGINTGWSFEKVVKFVKKLNVDDTKIRTDQAEVKLHLLSPNRFNSISDTPESTILITNQCDRIKLHDERYLLRPTEYVAVINISTDGPQGNPPMKSIELSTILPREKTKMIIKRKLGKIPDNWNFNPLPR